MTSEEFSVVLDRLQGHTQYVYYHLMGEPLTHPELPLFLQMARERGFRSVITTNGTLLPRRGDELLASGVHKVSISVHSFEDGSDAEFDRYMNGICEFAERASLQGVIVVLRLWNRGYDGGRNDVIYEYLRRRFDGEWAENTRGIRIRDKLHIEWGDRFEWPDENAPVQGDHVFCYGLTDHFGILVDGSVVPCCMDSEGVITLGNIYTEDIDSILHSERAERMLEGFRSRTASEALCRRCGYAQRFI